MLRILPALLLAAALVCRPAAPALAQAPFDFARADSVAQSAPAPVQTVASLGAHFRASLPEERDRARAIYRWLVENIAYDADLYFRGTMFPPAQDAESVLQRGRGVCEGFSALFLALAREAGLEARIIIGEAKAYDPRRAFRVQQHAWNAVRFDGQWHLLDASWGAGEIRGRTFVRNPRDYYFAPDPARFIWSHHPNASEWQLLDEPLPRRAFRRLPFTHPDFWTLGVSADTAFAAAAAPGFPGFAGVFPAAGQEVQVLRAPLTRTLVPGEPQLFRIRAPGATEVIAAGGGVWQPLAREGDVFSGSAAIAADRLVVMVRSASNPEGAVILEYVPAARGRAGR